MDETAVTSSPEKSPRLAGHVGREISRGNPWYTEEQTRLLLDGPYRHVTAHRQAIFARMLRAAIRRENPVVADLGCGDGTWLPFLRSYSRRLLGLDYNPLRLGRAHRSVLPAGLVQGSLDALPLRDGTVDILFLNQVLEHIPHSHIDQVLQECRRALRTDGSLILSVPHEGHWLARLHYRRLQPRIMRETDHKQFFTRRTLEALLARNGFRVEECQVLGFHVPHIRLHTLCLEARWACKMLDWMGRVIPSLSTTFFMRLAVQQEDSPPRGTAISALLDRTTSIEGNSHPA